MDEPRQPLSEDTPNLCPLCGAVLIQCVGTQDEEAYEGVRCLKGCDLWSYYN